MTCGASRLTVQADEEFDDSLHHIGTSSETPGELNADERLTGSEIY